MQAQEEEKNPSRARENQRPSEEYLVNLIVRLKIVSHEFEAEQTAGALS